MVQFLQSYWSIVQADPLPFIVLAAICLSMGFGAGLWMRKEQITILKTRLEFGQGKLGPKIEQSDIDYPKSGFYGENLLSPMTSDLKPRQEYSLAVNINTRKKIRVRFSHTNQYSFGLWYYGTGSLKGWLARTYQKDAREQWFEISGPIEGDGMFIMDKNTYVTIELYAADAALPFFSKKVVCGQAAPQPA